MKTTGKSSLRGNEVDEVGTGLALSDDDGRGVVNGTMSSDKICPTVVE
jgi:hypothetical protein